ncbi:MAG TPA: type IV pilus assembly protein PilM, partial [bacterium]|nr:type IV pilus assembly protein PilM [bacterium]
MVKVPDVVIDIGQQQIKLLQIQVDKKGGVTVKKAGVERLMLSSEEESDTAYQRIQETLPILLQRLGVKARRAVVSLPGRSAFTRRLRVPVVRGRQLQRIIKYEARQHIPFPLEQVNMDYQITPSSGDSEELEVNLVAVRSEIAESYSKVLKKCGIRSDIIEVAPLSLYNAYAASKLRDIEEVTAVVCIGASSTDIVIEQNGVMQFMRSAPVAGNALTTLLAKSLDLPPDKAEDLKKKPAAEFSSANPGVAAEQVSSILERGFDRIITEIRRSFDFYVSQPDAQPVTRIFLCGGSVRMEGVCEFLEDRLGVPVSIFHVRDVEGFEYPPEYADLLDNEAVLAGMAVRAAGRASCGLSFAPPAIKQKLEFERRTPMFSVMALLLAAMVGGAFYFLDQMLTTTAEAVDRVQEIVQPTKKYGPELGRVRGEQNKFLERYTRINEVANKRGRLTRVYLEVQRLVPQDIWLKSIDVGSGKMEINGRALNDERIATYIQELMLSPFFDNEVVVLKSSNPASDIPEGGSVQMDFVISIDRYNNPTPEEIKFVDEFRKLTKEGEVLLTKFERADQTNVNAPTTLVVGVYRRDTDQEKISLFNIIYSCLLASGDTAVQTIDVRFHDRESNLVEHIQVPVELMKKYRDKTIAESDLVTGFIAITPSPSPAPTPTPTPEKEGGEEA